MARVFTIAEGLENMGALRSGGQGSVYKGRRTGEIITAIKILPTPIASESSDDKNYVLFQNEVQKLQKVNESPNPHIATILGSGVTESGNFPYIEMEFIEGPDLSDLLKPPHDPIFPIREVIKVALQLSEALAHCHRLGVRHGDIKSNNVKFNVRTGNYVLLDFGMAMMSDEQRRTSIRHAGAIEFMAPEQNDGRMLFETDVYSFGIILFELLTGQVPFPLKDSGETSRNAVMMAHLETTPPDLMSIRKKALPEGWSLICREHEMLVPQWLVGLVYRCLQKSPADRYPSGIELHDEIVRNTITGSDQQQWQAQLLALQEENEQLRARLALLENREAVPQNAHNVSNQKPDLTRKPTPQSRIHLFWAIGLLVAMAAVYFLLNGSFKGTKMQVISSDSARMKGQLKPLNDSISLQLNEARVYLVNHAMPRALAIYKTLSDDRVPEGMYQYSTLALQNLNPQLSCKQAFELLIETAEMGYAPAKRTAGFLYAHADRPEALKESGYFDRCSLVKNRARGAKLLMEAMIQGDTVALRLLESMNQPPPGPDK